MRRRIEWISNFLCKAVPRIKSIRREGWDRKLYILYCSTSFKTTNWPTNFWNFPWKWPDHSPGIGVLISRQFNSSVAARNKTVPWVASGPAAFTRGFASYANPDSLSDPVPPSVCHAPNESKRTQWGWKCPAGSRKSEGLLWMTVVWLFAYENLIIIKKLSGLLKLDSFRVPWEMLGVLWGIPQLKAGRGKASTLG